MGSDYRPMWQTHKRSANFVELKQHQAEREKEVKNRRESRIASKSKNGLDKTSKLQAELYEQGYAPEGMTFEQFVDGKDGKLTRDAENRRRLAQEMSNRTWWDDVKDTVSDAYNYVVGDESIGQRSLPARVTANIFGADAINHVFPYGYNRSTDSKNWESSEQAALYDLLTGGDRQYRGYARSVDTGTQKLLRGMAHSDIAGNACLEFADLDLNTSEGKARAKELWKVIRSDEPRYGPGGDWKQKQASMRARIDANLIHTGQGMKYNTYTRDTGFTNREKKQTWGFTDPTYTKMYQRWAQNYIRTHKPTKEAENFPGTYIWEIQGGDPLAIWNKFSLYAEKGKNGWENARWQDDWDLGMDGKWGDVASTKVLPGFQQALFGQRF